MDNFRFVAHGILREDLKQSTPQDIYNELCKKFERSHSYDAERTVTTTIFREVCVCAGFGDTSHTGCDSDINNTHRLNNLNRFCVSERFDNKESILQQLHYRKKLLEVGEEICKHDALKKIAVLFKESQRGTHPETIRTPIDLFTRLLQKRILRSEDLSSMNILLEKLEAAKKGNGYRL